MLKVGLDGEPVEEFNFSSKIKTKRNLISFTDVTTIILAQHHQIDLVLSFDDHFDRFMTRIS